ncbi:MAG: AI-2E family transporter [Clostridia bacterium]|nr:AI-2E family transporter [Clostridia bacterium]
MNELKKDFSKWMYWFLFATCVIIVYNVLSNFVPVTSAIGKFFGVISPFLMGMLIAYILYIPASAIERKLESSKLKLISKKARGLSVLIAYIIAVIIITIIMNVVLPVVVESVVELVNNFQGYYSRLLEDYSKLPEDSFIKSEQVKQVLDSIKNINLSEYINVEKIMEYAKGAISIVTSVFDAFVTIIVSIYALLERGNIMKFAKRITYAIFGENTSKRIGKYFDSTNHIFFKFLASQILDAVIVGILITVVLSIMKIKYAVLIGFMIGLFNIIPYFGAIVAVALSILITLITGGLTQAIWMAIVVIILQQIDANIINPKIVGNSLEISALLIIFAVTVGGAYFGILGMFLAVPVVAVLKILINDYIEYKGKMRQLKN